MYPLLLELAVLTRLQLEKKMTTPKTAEPLCLARICRLLGEKEHREMPVAMADLAEVQDLAEQAARGIPAAEAADLAVTAEILPCTVVEEVALAVIPARLGETVGAKELMGRMDLLIKTLL